MTPLRSLLALAACLPCAGVPAASAEPSVFAPGVISSPLHDTAPAFSADGQTVWFSRSAGSHSTILVSQQRAGHWTPPQTAPFSGRWSDMEPALSPDGRFLVFASNRPATEGGAPLDGFFMRKRFPGGGAHLWRVDRDGDGWGPPVQLPAEINASDSTFAPSVARDGSLYFMRATADGARFHLYRAQAANGSYRSAELLPFSGGDATDVDPAVAPDESFVVFGSTRPPARGMDLFIAFRLASGWSEPVHLGDRINSAGSDAEPRLSPDGRTLYFSSERLVPSNSATGADWNNGKYNIWSASLAPWLAMLPAR